jgi:hypothetical protein
MLIFIWYPGIGNVTLPPATDLLVFPEITFGTLTVSATCRRSVLQGKSERMENRMQQEREVCIPMFLPVKLALSVTQAAATYSRLLSHLLA